RYSGWRYGGIAPEQLLRGRLAAATVQLRHPGAIPEPREVQRLVPAAARRADCDGRSEFSGADLQCNRHLHGGPDSAQSRPPAVGRHRDGERQRRAAVLAIRRSPESGRPARRQDLPDGQKRIQANVDLYNLFNASSVVNYTATYG